MPEGQLRAMERQLVEKALHESRALLLHLSLPPPSSSSPSPDAKRSGPHSRTALTPAAATGGSLVDWVASLDAPGKTLLDFWAPQELASVQQVSRMGAEMGGGQGEDGCGAMYVLNHNDRHPPCTYPQVCRRWRVWALPRAAEYFWNLLICQCWCVFAMEIILTHHYHPKSHVY